MSLPPLARMMSRPALLRSSAKMRHRSKLPMPEQTELKQALDESEKRALALERENAAQKQTADARQTALDKSEARSEALARELASARKNDVAARAAALERENAAQKQTADAKQTELKQALDESEKRALARARKCRTEANCRCQADGIEAGARRKRGKIGGAPLARMMSRPALLRSSAKMPHRSKLPMPSRRN